MKKIIASLLLFSVLLSSCTVTNFISMKDELTSKFIGMQQHEIIKMLGAPNRETSDGLDGVIMVYEDSEAYSTTVMSYGYAFTRTRKNTEFLELYINKDKVCYDLNTNYTRPEVETDAASTVFAVIGGLLGAAALVGATIWCVGQAR